MATKRRKVAARRKIKRVAKEAKRRQTLKNLPQRTRTALGKQASKVKRAKQG